MGPLATKPQLEEVKAGIDRLRAAGEPALGGGGRGDLFDPPPGKGDFVGPALFVCPDPRSPAVHEREVFGPVQTLMPYDGKAESASALVNQGLGGLVASLY